MNSYGKARADQAHYDGYGQDRNSKTYEPRDGFIVAVYTGCGTPPFAGRIGNGSWAQKYHSHQGDLKFFKKKAWT